MSLLVVGSVAFDEVETPFGKRDKMLGGSASHFSISASYYTDVRVVGVVGGDFSSEDEEVFARHGVDTTDLERIPDGQTFRWRGRYEFDLNTAHTLETQLNVFADFKPKLSEASKQARLVFLDRKSTRLNSSHSQISYAVFCLKKKKKKKTNYHVS